MDALTAAIAIVEEHADELRGQRGETGTKGDTGRVGPRGIPGRVGPQGPAGQDGESIRWRGKWKDGSYQPLDAVEFEGSSYICTSPTTASPKGSGWDLMAERGKDGGPSQTVVRGFSGTTGSSGSGLPAGGVAGQPLVKQSASDGDAAFASDLSAVDGGAGEDGEDFTVSSGSGDDGDATRSKITWHGGSPTNGAGWVEILTRGSAGSPGNSLLINSDGKSEWGPASPLTPASYSITNDSPLRTLDASSFTPTDLANFLATLIRDLGGA